MSLNELDLNGNLNNEIIYEFGIDGNINQILGSQ